MRILVPVLLVAVSACTPTTQGVAPDPVQPEPAIYKPRVAADYPPACAAQFPPNPNIAAWSADKFAGAYRSGERALTVRRERNHLLVEQPGKAATQVNSDNVEQWLFRDGCGTSYQFMLPPDGPGAWLTVTTSDGVKTEWSRSGY
jgi:hypothetical protein